MEGDVILMQDIFRFNQTGISADGHAEGHFEACGVRPGILSQIEAEGVHLPEHFFQRRVLESGAGIGQGN